MLSPLFNHSGQLNHLFRVCSSSKTEATSRRLWYSLYQGHDTKHRYSCSFLSQQHDSVINCLYCVSFLWIQFRTTSESIRHKMPSTIKIFSNSFLTFNNSLDRISAPSSLSRGYVYNANGVTLVFEQTNEDLALLSWSNDTIYTATPYASLDASQ